jgi:hypothetical protein
MVTKRKLRTELLKVRVTEDERAKFEKLAIARHTDLSEVIRQLLHREAAISSQEAA